MGACSGTVSRAHQGAGVGAVQLAAPATCPLKEDAILMKRTKPRSRGCHNAPGAPVAGSRVRAERRNGKLQNTCNAAKSPSGTSSGALGRRDFVRPEFIAMLNDAGGPCWTWSYESRAGL